MGAVHIPVIQIHYTPLFHIHLQSIMISITWYIYKTHFDTDVFQSYSYTDCWKLSLKCALKNSKLWWLPLYPACIFSIQQYCFTVLFTSVSTLFTMSKPSTSLINNWIFVECTTIVVRWNTFTCLTNHSVQVGCCRVIPRRPRPLSSAQGRLLWFGRRGQSHWRLVRFHWMGLTQATETGPTHRGFHWIQCVKSDHTFMVKTHTIVKALLDMRVSANGGVRG